LPVASITSFIGDHGVYAVFLLMAASGVVPAASELVMIYAGAVASGAIPSAHVVLFGHEITSHGWAYVTMALAGLAGNTLGAIGGWVIGNRGGRPFLDRHGRWLHLSQRRITRAERWFERFGSVAVPLGFAAPVVRSFVAIPAGVFRVPFAQFVPLAIVGCAVFCFGLAAGGYALGSSYDTLDSAIRYLGIALVAFVVLVAAVVLLRRRSSKLARRAEDSAR
jgi:membrane protein DedA with SNARE-associated domain